LPVSLLISFDFTIFPASSRLFLNYFLQVHSWD